MLVAEGSMPPADELDEGAAFPGQRGQRTGRYNPEMAIDIREGCPYVHNLSAYQNHAEDICGSLEVGKCGFTGSRPEYFEIPADEIEHTEVLMTMCGGRVVYRKGDSI